MPRITDLLEPFVRDRRGQGKKAAGVQRYVDCLKRIERWLDRQGISDVAAVDSLVVSDYRDYAISDVGNSPSTVSKHLTALRAFARWAMKRGHMASDPTVDVVWPVFRRPAPKPLSPDELRLLRQILEDEPEEDEGSAWYYHRRNSLAIWLMYYAGLRLAEVARLRVRDVNLVAATVTIRDSKTEDRSVALHADLVEVLQLELAGRKPGDPVIATALGAPLKATVLAKIFEAPRGWLARRGLRISAHRLRHSFGTELLRACGNLGVVQRAMGHASPETTMGYAQVVVEDQREAVAKLPPLAKRKAAAD